MTHDTEEERMRATRDAAADWFVRLQSDQADEADWQAFAAWLAAAPEHDRAYRAVEEMWISLENEQAEATLAPQPEAVVVPLRPARRRSGAAWLLPAGGFAAAAAAAAIFLTPALRTAPTVEYATAKGETRIVALADGSKIQLNSASSIGVRLDRKARRVTMNGDAEAAFDVAKDPTRPFLINVADQRIKVVGTEFDVLRQSGRLVVTVRRGLVQVSPAEGDEPPVLLKVGQQLVRDKDGATVRDVDPEAAFAWRERRLVYQSEKLGAIVDDLNRYFATPIRVEGAAANLTFSGVLVIDGEDAVVGRLEAYLPVAAEHRSDAIVLRSRSAR